MWENLFSITKELRSGINISNDGETLILSKGNIRIEFFEKFGGVKGYFGGPNEHKVENINDNKVVFHSKKKVDIKDFHVIWVIQTRI